MVLDGSLVSTQMCALISCSQLQSKQLAQLAPRQASSHRLPAGEDKEVEKEGQKELVKHPSKNVPKPQEGGDAPIWRVRGLLSCGCGLCASMQETQK